MALWQIALSDALLGVTPLALRLPSAILASLAVLCTYLIGVRLFDRVAALVAAALQAFNPVMLMLVHGYVFSDHVDISLLFWTELSLLFLLRTLQDGSTIDAILCGIFQGLAFLSKTYPALIVSGLAVLFWLVGLVSESRTQNRPRVRANRRAHRPRFRVTFASAHGSRLLPDFDLNAAHRPALDAQQHHPLSP